MASIPARLSDYNRKRDFTKTLEPSGKVAASRNKNLVFLVQKHAASRLHYDLRLEWGGVLWSWAVTRGPSNDPAQKRLAVRTEDHPLKYKDFEGTIAKGEYGGGTVMLWDQGIWEPLHDPAQGIADGKLHFRIRGDRMKGGWALVRMRKDNDKNNARENWLLIKERDEDATTDPDELVTTFEKSIKTGRTMAAIAEGRAAIRLRKQTTKKSSIKPTNDPLSSNPKFHKPQLATSIDAAPEGDDWLHETKFDGYRCQVSIGKDGVQLFTRSGRDWTERFEALVPSLRALPCRSALIDGEVMSGSNGETSTFSALQKDLKTGGPLLYFAFDLLLIDGVDIRSESLLDRKRKLEQLLERLPKADPVRYSTHIVGQGAEIFQRICKSGGEGILSKRTSSPYRSTRNRDWLKIKCTKRQEFVVGGFSPSDKRGRPFASLLVGAYEDGKLQYKGRVGTGYSEADMDELSKLFDRQTRKTSPFTETPKSIGAHAKWVTPSIVIEVDFSEFTADGHIRHGAFIGQREDRNAKSVKTESSIAIKSSSAKSSGVEKTFEDSIVGRIEISHPERELFPGAGVTKYDLARYYDMAGERLVKIAGKRPLSLVRCPQGLKGDCFFQKHTGKGFPKELREVTIKESDGDTADYLYVTTKPGFVAAAQMGTMEFHIWGSRVDKLERPDRLVFDLDPDESLSFDDVKSAALHIKQQLKKLGMESISMVTGGKGVHVCVPLRRTITWKTLKIFAKTLASLLAEKEPDRFTTTMSKAHRKGKIFIDWLRNERGATAVTPYSVRARIGAPVATPVTWAELKKLKAANTFSIGDMKQRLDKPCPYLKACDDPQTLGAETLAALDDLFNVR